MNKLHRDPKYKKQSGLVHSQFWNWSNSRWSTSTSKEIEILRALSLEVYKMAKSLEEAATQSPSPLDDCLAGKHNVNVWHTNGYTIKERKPIMRGECSECLAEITDYGKSS